MALSVVPQSPLIPILNEINRAVKSGFPFLAVAMTVALPDICVSLISADGRSTGERYKQWCTANLDNRFSFVTGEDLWSMRCGVLHNGRFGDLKHNVDRIVFALPESRMIATNNMMNGAYFYSVVEFCHNFTDCVRIWYAGVHGDPTVQSNLPRLMQYRVGGMLPYVMGETIIA